MALTPRLFARAPGPERPQLPGPWFWTLLGALVLCKLALTSDFTVLIQLAPHDDGLYVARAYHLLAGEAFGPYDARLLTKLPGISLWLAASRTLGIPYLLSIDLLYFAAGAYFLHGLWRCGFGSGTLLGVAALYLFNPVTLTEDWIRVIRDPLAACLLVVLLAAMLHALLAAQARRIGWSHVLVIAAVAAFVLLLREEDFLLYGLLVFFAAALLRQLRAAGTPLRGRVATAAAVAVMLPFACGYGANLLAREYVQAHYGVALIHDFGDGEFPVLIAAMRSLESRKDNRFVMVTQEALGRLRSEVPRLAPLIERLPRPGPGTYSCRRYGVCSEWANGWMPFWIKDAAFEAGLTPDARSAQEYFRLARIDIERACAEGRLKCRDTGRGLLPRFELRWTRAYLQEWSTLVGMWLAPRPTILQEVRTRFDVDSVLARMFQIVTMTHQADTRLQAPAATPLAQPAIDAALREWRVAVGTAYSVLGGAVELAAAAALVYLYRRRRSPLHGPFVATAVLFGLYTGLRLCALAYAAVYMGNFDLRMIFSSYIATLLICPALIAEAYTLRLAVRRAQ